MEKKAEQKNPKQMSKKRWIILVSSLLAVVVIVTVGFFVIDDIKGFFAKEEEPVVIVDENGYDTQTPFRVAIPSEGEFQPEGIYQKSLNRLASLSDAPIEWIRLSKGNAYGSLRKKVTAGKYPEVVFGNYFSSEEILQYAKKGLLVPLEEYINEKDTPNLWKLFEECPEIKAQSVTPDGHIYTLPKVSGFEPEYLQNVLWMNKTWLDNLGLDVPETLDELKVVLRSFKDGDPNGNGITDEIPMTFYAKDSYAYPEALLSCWGISTHRGSEDAWLIVRDGEVNFAPTTDEWKDMIAYYRELYAEGLVDPDAFTHDEEEFRAKLLSPTSTVGLTWSNVNPMLNADEYIAIAPLRTRSWVRPAWRIHPNSVGMKDYFCIFKNCKNPGAAMRWIDKMYDFDNAVQNFYGEYGYAVSKTEEGKIVWNPSPEEEETVNTYYQRCVLLSGMPGAIPKTEYETFMELTPEQQSKKEVYQLYERYLDEEVWNRPYFTVEEKKVISDFDSDIFELVSTKMKAWIVGGEDLEADWDLYLNDLELMGLSDMLAVYRTAYGRYTEALSES